MGKVKGEKREYQHTTEEKIAKAAIICNLYESQGCTLESACKSVGITDRLFRYWCASISEVSDLYKKAKEKSIEIYWDVLREKAQSSLELLIEGTTYTEVKNESGIGASGAISKTTETEVRVLPNPTSVIFALKGEFPGRFSDKVQHTGKDGAPIKFEGVSLEDKLAALALLEGKKNGK